MQILKKVNNNVALAVDENGKDVVVFGKGIGFPKTPYELTDTSKIDRTFYNVSNKLMEVIETIKPEMLLAGADIADLASFELNKKLNPNLAFTLADHIQFAAENHDGGTDLVNPLEAEVDRVYPVELAVGGKAIGMIFGRTGIKLPDSEATNIALHIVNAEGAPGMEHMGTMHEVMESTHVVEHMVQLIEETYPGVKVDTGSYEFMRFAAHIRFLVARFAHDTLTETTNRSLFRQAALDFPEAYQCVARIDNWLRTERGWKCTEEELLYLMIHINRLVATDKGH